MDAEKRLEIIHFNRDYHLSLSTVNTPQRRSELLQGSRARMCSRMDLVIEMRGIVCNFLHSCSLPLGLSLCQSVYKYGAEEL